jgi:putative membrane protein
MVGAFVVSSLFLANYVAYHVQYGSTPFRGHGAWRIAYFSILIPHIVLAIGMLPFILVALVRALRGEFDRHVRLARRVLPVWLFVSASGVLVYWMLYRGTWP